MTNPTQLATTLAGFLNNATKEEREAFNTQLGVEATNSCPQGALLLALAIATALAETASGAYASAHAEVVGAKTMLDEATNDDEREEQRDALSLAKNERSLANAVQVKAEDIARKIRDEVPE
jgi:hypothetical protein